MNLNTFCITVPVYKSFNHLSTTELAALRQVFNLCGRENIFFVAPKGLVLDKYLCYALEQGALNISGSLFSDVYFRNIAGYNKLLTSLKFYESFSTFNYLLIYQTDAFIFKNDIMNWVNKGFDFIGAPWFVDYDKPVDYSFFGVGNGGFSLRNNYTALKILKRIRLLKSMRAFWFKFKFQHFYPFEKLMEKFSKKLHIKNPQRINEILFAHPANEDFWWTHVVGQVFSDFHVPTVEKAIPFSFEVNPSFLYKANNYELPLGCHAWEKYEPEFWKKFIPISIQ